MTRPHKLNTGSGKGAIPADSREALQWFVNNYGLYVGSCRGLFLSDWGEEQQASLEAVIINLKSRGFAPFTVSGETLYKQADYLWKESRDHTQFGRPLASKLELELGGNDVVIVDLLEAPENSRQLWYLFSQLLMPRAISGKPTIITTPLSYQEFTRYGDSCPDPDFCSKSVNWEKIAWLIEATMINLELFRLAREESLPPMLKAEYHLYTALKDRGLDVIPQHVLGDYLLDFAIVEKERRLNIECDAVSALGGSEVQRQDAKRNLVLLSDGWQVLKFTTGEIISNRAGCAEAVEEAWRTGRKKAPIGRLFTGNTVAPMPDLPVDDEVQVAAITHGGGPAAVCGGAGTGKTTCIVQRTAYLLSQNVNPESILVISHNQETTKFLRRSIEAVVEKQSAQRLSIVSWHDLGLKILKENLPAIKRKPPLKIETNVQKIIQRVLAKAKKEVDPAKLELSADLDEFYISAVISMYKAHLISPKQAKDDAQGVAEEIIAKVYQGLDDQLQKANRIDRDDVTTLTTQVLVENPEIRLRYQSQYEFVLIDDFQDVTVAQDMLARVLAAPQDNLFIVGDEDETITECRNACPELFSEMSLRAPHARCYMLEKNWRSHPAIVDHARQLVTGLTRRRIQKDFISAWGQASSGAIIGPERLIDERDEANWVAREIQILSDSGRALGDIAVLYRHLIYSNILEEALDNQGVQFHSTNPVTALIPDEAGDMMAFLKLIIDPDGPKARECFERICQWRVKEIDPKLSATIASFAEANNLSYLKAVEIYSEATADQSCRELEQLVRVIRNMNQEKLPAAEAISLIRRTQRLNDYYKSIKVPPGVNYEPLKKLSQLEEESRSFKSVSEFVKHITNQKQNTSGSGIESNGVNLIPLQDCKGLEFPVVFMIGMSEGIFPAESAMDLEEERRMCYVGFTRAKELLYLSYPAMFGGVMLYPSRFLIDSRLMVAPPMHQEPQPPVQPQVVAPPVVQQPPVPQPAPQPAPVQPVVQPAPTYTPPPVQPAPVQPAAFQPAPVQPRPTPQPAPVHQPPAPQPAPTPQPQPVPPQSFPHPVPSMQPIAPAAQMPPTPTIVPQPAVQPQAPPEPIAQPQRPVVQPQPPVVQPPVTHAPVAPAPQQLPPEPMPKPQQFPISPIADIAAQVAAQAASSQPTRRIPTSEFPFEDGLAGPSAIPERKDQPAAPEQSQQAINAGLQPYSNAPITHAPSLRSMPKSKAEPVRSEPTNPVDDIFGEEAAMPPVLGLGRQPSQPMPDPEPAPAAAQIPPQPAPTRPIPEMAPFPVQPGAAFIGAIADELAQTAEPSAPAKGGRPRKSSFNGVPQPVAEVSVEPPVVPPSTLDIAPPAGKRVAGDEIPSGRGVEDLLAEALGSARSEAQMAQDAEAYIAPEPEVYQEYEPQYEQQYEQPVAVEPPSPAYNQDYGQTGYTDQAPSYLHDPSYYQAVVQPTVTGHTHQYAAPAPYDAAMYQHHEHSYPANEGSPMCPSCSNPLEASARFCGECGYSLPERIPACPGCGAPLEPSAKFCGECGTSLNSPVTDPGQVNQMVNRYHDLKDKQQGWMGKLLKKLES